MLPVWCHACSAAVASCYLLRWQASGAHGGPAGWSGHGPNALRQSSFRVDSKNAGHASALQPQRTETATQAKKRESSCRQCNRFDCLCMVWRCACCMLPSCELHAGTGTTSIAWCGMAWQMSVTDAWRPKRPGPASDRDNVTRQTLQAGMRAPPPENVTPSAIVSEFWSLFGNSVL